MDGSKKKSRNRTLSVDEIIELYKGGKSTTEIGNLANVSARYICMLLNEHNVEFRPRGSWKRKYTLNEDYFKTWSNNMAYILGFFIDGTVAPRNAQFVSISQKEKYILEDIRTELGSNQPLFKNELTSVYTLNLNSKIMKRDLMEIHGIMPNKSHQIEFPYVPEQYMGHFIRGYFDGDGYVNYEKFTVTFTGGSKQFMVQLIEILIDQGFKPHLTSKNNHFRVHIRGRKSINLFAKWVYKDKILYLRRKHEIFVKEVLEIDKLKDRKDICTIDCVAERKLRFLTIYAVLNSLDITCECMGIKPATPKRWIKNDELFKYNFNKVKRKVIG